MTYLAIPPNEPLHIIFFQLSMGMDGYKKLLAERKENFGVLREELGRLAEAHGERVLETRGNPISIGEEIHPARSNILRLGLK